MNDIQKLRQLSELTAQADAVLVAVVEGRGIDGHGHPLPDLESNLKRGLDSLIVAGELARRLRAGARVEARPGGRGSVPPEVR